MAEGGRELASSVLFLERTLVLLAVAAMILDAPMGGGGEPM